MAEAIGIAIISALGTSATVATSVGIAGVSLATIVGTTTLVGGSLALSALTSDNKDKVAAQQFASKQPIPSRRLAWGTVKLSGPYVAFDAHGGSFYNAVYLCEGPIGGILEYWLDDKKAALAEYSLGGPAGVAPWNAAVTLEARLGTATQDASPLLRNLPYWGTNHRLLGCAYVAMRAKAPSEDNFKKRFPSGTWPSTRALIRGSKVYNPNDPTHDRANPDTWSWSDLASLCILDLLTREDWGMRVPYDLIDIPSFAAFTTLCFLPVNDKSGTPHPRYFLGGTLDLTDDPADTLQSMLDACDARLYLTTAGKIGITGGQYVAPTVTIAHKDVLSIGTLEQGSGKRATFNRLKISFVSPHHDYQVTEGDPWEDLAGQADAGEILEADFSRPFVQNHNQLRRLAKIYTARANPAFRITGLVTNRGGLPALFEDGVILDLPRYGISGPFEVQRAVASGDGGTVTFDLVSLDPDAWTFNAATEEGIAPPLPDADAAEAAPDVPVALTTLVERRAVSGGTNAVFVRLLATQPAREDLSLIGRYRRVGDVDWLDMGREGDNRGAVISSVLADGEQYEVEGAIATYARSQQSAWIAAAGSPITATADTTPPDGPRGLTGTGGVGSATLKWTNGNSPNVASARLYRGATLIQTIPSGPNQYIEIADTRPPGVHEYSVECVNASGVASSPRLGPVSVTVT